MKKQTRIIKIALILVVTLFSINYSYAAIQIKDTTESVITNKTISEFYDMAKEMKNAGQGLEGTTVDVHMTNNYEWAVVSYFSNSSYGTGGAGKNKGVLLEGTSHYSTNGNITGVMDWGKSANYTAGVISNYANIVDTSETKEPYDYGKSIIEDVKKNNEYVDLFVNENQYKSAAAISYDASLYNSWCSIEQQVQYPFSVRTGLFGFEGGKGHMFGVLTAGGGRAGTTFRPIFYAQ